MNKSLVLARRELASYFVSPMAYIVGALYLLVAGTLFFWDFPFFNLRAVFVPGNEASLRQLFDNLAYIMVFVVPLLTMRLMSDEYRSGSIETLVTAPITDAQIILGKFLGVLGFYVVLLALTVVFLGLMIVYGQPDAGVALTGYLGMLLLGSAFAAVGLFTSTISAHQIVAALLGIAILGVMAFAMQVMVVYSPAPWNTIASKLNAMTYFKDFSRGIFDTRGLVFFLSVTVMFLFFSIKSLESRRWR